MTGIVAAAASISSGLIFGAGLYRTLPSGTVDTSPIDVSTQSSQFSSFTETYQWQGYLKATSTGIINLGANCPYQEWFNPNGPDPAYPVNWGGGGNSTCYIWTGATARSGYNTGNFTAFIQNGSGSVPFTVVNNTYYLLRVQWSTTLPRTLSAFGIFYAESSFELQINSSGSISSQIFYNTQTNGF